MKRKRLIIFFSAVVVLAGATTLGIAYTRHREVARKMRERLEMQKAAMIFRELDRAYDQAAIAYYNEEPANQFKAMSNVAQLIENADPMAWEFVDWGTYAAEVYGRASIAAEHAGLTTESDAYRKKAVMAWISRQEWSNKHHDMRPITPTPDYATADTQLFNIIRLVDDAAHSRIAPPSPEEIAAQEERLQAVANEVLLRRKLRQQQQNEN